MSINTVALLAKALIQVSSSQKPISTARRLRQNQAGADGDGAAGDGAAGAASVCGTAVGGAEAGGTVDIGAF
jgi:hypothetical protein